MPGTSIDSALLVDSDYETQSIHFSQEHDENYIQQCKIKSKLIIIRLLVIAAKI